MRNRRRLIPAFATIVLVLAACGGGGGGTANSTPADGVATSEPAPEATSAAPTVEVPPTSATGPTEPPSGGTAKGVCELVTVEELAEIFGVASVTTTVFSGPPDTCSVESDTGEPLVAWSYSTAQSAVVFQALTSDPSAVLVDGIGDQAAIVQNTGLLVLKGDSLVVVGVQSGEDELAKEVGKAAAARM